MQVTYDYPANGGYADTIATLSDGRKLWINTQYSDVVAKHADGCHKGQCSLSVGNVCAEGSRRRQAACTCGALTNVDITALLTDAKINGKCGPRPTAPAPKQVEPEIVKRGPGWCNKCHSYCYGDCEAN